jgi:hypothetical protein
MHIHHFGVIAHGLHQDQDAMQDEAFVRDSEA